MPLRQNETPSEAEGRRETRRRALWARLIPVLESLHEEDWVEVCSWLGREHGLQVEPNQMEGASAPASLPTSALQRLLAGLAASDLQLTL